MKGRGARFALAALLVAACLRSYRVEGGSMEPTLRPGDRLVGEWLSLLLGSPCRGGVYAVEDPDRPGHYLIKRVVGVPGDALALRGATLFRNGGPSPEGYARYAAGGLRDLPAVQVGPGRVVVLGDHRDASRDSRELGPLPVGGLAARLWIRIWPPSRWGAVR